ncbi:phosphotransferase [Streptacidiphilus sp. N1-3]|uniref:Phosphotransferase n=1 Tax=Streptacidiphilus alkalitolerans TaxID=3342712 RepID=A0ABV6XAT5_9ACTN
MTTTANDLERLAGRAEIVADHSWPGTSTTVLRLRKPDGRQMIAKLNSSRASFEREHYALSHWTRCIAPCSPQLIDADTEQGVLLMTAVPGQPLSTLTLPDDEEEEAYWQTGALLRLLHMAAPQQTLPHFGRDRAAYIRAQFQNGMAPLSPDEIDLTLDALTLLEELPPQQAQPSHLDLTSRNILWDGNRASILDFETSRYEAVGRDFLRITQRTLREHHGLRDAFYDGYGRTPTAEEETLMRICGVTDAAAIAITSTAAGQHEFATEAHRAVAAALGCV